MIRLIEEAMSQINADYELREMKNEFALESAMREFNINKNEAELKVMQESGTEDDLAYLFEAVANGYLERVIDVIAKIKASIIKFFSELKDKVIKFFSNVEDNEKLDRIEKKIKLNPFLKNKKILVEDVDKQMKVCDEHISMLAKLQAKLKSGGKVTNEDVEEVKDSYKKKIATVAGVASAVTVTTVAAIAIIKKRRSDSPKVLDYNSTMAAGIINGVADNAKKNEDGLDPQFVSVVTNIAQTASSFAKDKANIFVNSIPKTFSKLNEAFNKVKGNSKIVSEGAEEDDVLDLEPEVMSQQANDIEDEEDPWASIMDEDPAEVTGQIGNDEEPEECGECDNCAEYGGYKSYAEMTTDELFDSILGEVYESNSEEKYYDEMSIDQILEEVEKEVFGDEEEPVQESVFESLLAQVESLSFED